MDVGDGRRDVVDPEVRAYVSSLVAALGGSGADEEGRYVLGDDALAVLRDLKRWLKLYDEKANRLDVARCLAESNLVGGDLLQILAAWPENATDDKIKSKIALACLEILVPLTWPLEKTKDMTVNHLRHTPFLQLAQLAYKRSIINFDGARILHTAVRVALPSMAQPMAERSTRDQGIIRLVLFFVRNMAMIAPPPGVVYEGDEAEISRSATMAAFDYQDILHLLLTLSSTMGEEFNIQDVVVMEIIFHLVKGVDIEKLFLDEEQLDQKQSRDLANLRDYEAGLLRGYARSAPTRHNRFGTMVWIQREDHKMSTVSGQDALIDGARSLEKMDKSKKFRPPRRTPKSENGPLDFDSPSPLNYSANKYLRAFVEEFLDSGFNPLFQHIRKAIDREAERILEYHPRQFFYLVSWFLEAERLRRKSKPKQKNNATAATGTLDPDSFAIVASVLNQEMFVTLNRAMESSYENKSWQDLNAAMKCFTQILLTVQEMSESSLDEDQEIAENILSRIFYEETTHDRVANITRYYKDQGFGYLDSCTELAHNYLRILENYSKQNTDLQIRSKRRARRRKKAAQESGIENTDNQESEGEDEADAVRSSSERKFDFKRFAARFLSQGAIDTFATFCRYYRDLKPEQLKRAHRFFYRVAFKMEMSVMLFRVDIVALFHKMIKGPEGLDPASPVFKEWDELVRQLIKRCMKKLKERPELFVEMLFSKTNGIAHYLEYGYEKQTITSRPRAAAELEVRNQVRWEDQVAAVVSCLHDRNEGEHLDWIKGELSSAEINRRSWEGLNTIVPSVEQDASFESPDEQSTAKEATATIAPVIVLHPDNELRRVALFKNGHLRLLLKLLDLQNLAAEDEPTTAWVIPSALSADRLKKSLDLIRGAEFSPPIFDNGLSAADQIRRKSAAPKRRAAFDDEDDLVDDDDLAHEEFLFAPGGPTAMKKSDALEALKKTRRKRRRSGDDNDARPALTDDQLSAREAARRAKELEKMRRLKSDLYVHDSDDESDEERDRAFFEQEEKLRQQSKATVLEQLRGVTQKKAEVTTSRKRKLVGGFVDDDSEDEMPSAQSSSVTGRAEHGRSEDDGNDTETPISSQSEEEEESSQSKRPRLTGGVSEVGNDLGKGQKASTASAQEFETGENEDEEDVAASRPTRRRVGAFVVDSSDEE